MQLDLLITFVVFWKYKNIISTKSTCSYLPEKL